MARMRDYRRLAGMGAGAAMMMSAAWGGGCASSGDQETFATPQDGMEAVVISLRQDDRARLERILGPEAEETLYSGDEVADRARAEEFLDAYDTRHRLETMENGETVLMVGDHDWPMPIPLVQEGSAWRFDMETGKEEVLTRRIGRNELHAIETCRAIVDAQQEYRARTSASGSPVYAAKFMSDPGVRDGLYWPTVSGEKESPLGPLVGGATSEGYSLTERSSGSSEPRAYEGYCYRMLLSQGESAPGGKRHYLVDGHLREGFGVVAYPVAYERSGIMTFIVCANGIVYEQDFGEGTERIGRTMTEFNPDEDWRPLPDSASVPGGSMDEMR